MSNNEDYTNISRPYDALLARNAQDIANTSPTTKTSATSAAPVSGGASGPNGLVETQPVKSDGAMADVWIKNFIRSENWKPKTVGFYIDGQTGYAEFSNVYVSGDIQALTGTIGGFTIGATTLSASAGGNSTVISSGPIAFSAGPTGAPTLTITQAGVISGVSVIVTKLDIPDTTSANSFHVDILGNIWSGANASNFSSAKFSVTNAGALKAESGIIGGYTIGPTSLVDAGSAVITGGIIQTSALTTVDRIKLVGTGGTNAIEFWTALDEKVAEIVPLNSGAGFGGLDILSLNGGAGISVNGKNSQAEVVMYLPGGAFLIQFDGNDISTSRIFTDMRIESDWSPYANTTYDLGSTSYQWAGAYINSLQLYYNGTLRGSISGDTGSANTVYFSMGTATFSGDVALNTASKGFYAQSSGLFGWLGNGTALTSPSSTMIRSSTNFDVQGNITVTGNVDGVDVSSHNHSGAGQGGAISISHSSLSGVTADQHHSSTSSGINITPVSVVTSGSGTGASSPVKGYAFCTTFGQIYYNSNLVLDMYTASTRSPKNFYPGSDNSVTCGGTSFRWSDLRSVLINGADIGFDNSWYITESYRLGIEEDGLGVLNSQNEMVLFIGDSGLYVKSGLVKNLDNLAYTKTTLEQRIKMDLHPELRSHEADKEILEMPDPKKSKIGGFIYTEKKRIIRANIRPDDE